MKGQYYPSRYFLDARLGGQPSYGWRCIHSIRWILDDGAQWKFGNGCNVHIWSQCWLLGYNCGFVLNPQSVDAEVTLVSHLIDHDTRSWQSSLVDEIFIPCEATIIKSFPLSECVISPSSIIPCSNNGALLKGDRNGNSKRNCSSSCSATSLSRQKP